MSRVAKQPILIPQGVEVVLSEKEILVKGPKGTLTQEMSSEIKIVGFPEESDKKTEFHVQPRKSTKHSGALSGTFRSLFNNMVIGVTDGFEISLDLVGVGYRASLEGNGLVLSLGFSHPVVHALPKEVKAELPTATRIVLKSSDKQKVGQEAAKDKKVSSPRAI